MEYEREAHEAKSDASAQPFEEGPGSTGCTRLLIIVPSAASCGSRQQRG